MRYHPSTVPVAARTAAAFLAVLTAACGGETTPMSNPPPPARTAAKASPSGDGQTGGVQTTLGSPLRVIVTNDGAPEAGVTVTWSGSGTAASFSPTTTTTDASGIASTTWTLPRQSGLQSASAAVANANGSPVVFGATATPGPPTSLSLLDGDNQVGAVGTPAAAALRVTVTDQYGNGVSGQSVAWSVTSGSATLGLTTSTTATSGIATNSLTYGGTSGTIVVTASVTGLGSVGFSATAGVLVTVQANNTFSPQNITINAGDYVVWRWAINSVSHTVTPDPPGTEPPTSGAPRDYPATYMHQFTTPGTYNYHCEVHGGPGIGMIGTVTVQ